MRHVVGAGGFTPFAPKIRSTSPWGLGLIALVTVSLGTARAAEREQREFSIFIDGKEAGQSTMEITKQDDGLHYMTARVSVKTRQLLLDYSLGIDVAEWWRDGKLVGLKCQSIENGRRTEVVIATEGEKELKARVNGLAKADQQREVWTSSFWRLPDARFHNKAARHGRGRYRARRVPGGVGNSSARNS